MTAQSSKDNGVSRMDDPPQEPHRRATRLLFIVATAAAVVLVGGAVVFALSRDDGGDARNTLSAEAPDSSSEEATSTAPTEGPSTPGRGGGNDEFSDLTSCLRDAEAAQDQSDCLRFRPVLEIIPSEGTSDSDTTAASLPVASTPREEDVAEAEVVLPGLNDDRGEPALYRLGPAGAVGGDISSAQAVFEPTSAEWAVLLEFTGEGITRFNRIAEACFNGQPSCAWGRVAIVLDGRVVSAPSVQNPEYQRDEVNITGDFTEREARDLAAGLS